MVLVALCLWCWPQTNAQDSVRVITEVTVHGKIRHHETIEPQTLDAATLQQVNAHSVADALRFMSGVQLKDYGGIGGLKTINLRSMGSQHVGVYYDGIELGNAQNGVIDLGQFSLDNVETVSVYQGQRSAIMQTASDYASAGNLYIRTLSPRLLTHDRRQETRVKAQYGSAQTLRLSALHMRRLSKRCWLNANIEGLTSSGRYRFNYRRRNYDGSVAYDTTATRHNGDVQAMRAEVNVCGDADLGHWEAKAYSYLSARGIPGAIVNNVWRRGERQTDCNTFAQGSWTADVGDHYSVRAMAKYAHYYTHYLNRDTTLLMTDNRYHQHEGYVSVVQVVELRPWWSASLALDARLSHLSADVVSFAYPTRLTGLSALATAMDLGSVQLQGSLVYTAVSDHVSRGAQHGYTGQWTPALFVSWQPTSWMQLRGYAKRSFRMPTFNDLYYTSVGNADLEPEAALQYNVGITLCRGMKQSGSLADGHHWGLRLALDAYHNSVHDKIVAYPQGQQFRWTMLNLGRVHIDGIDVQGEAQLRCSGDVQLSARVQYTCQRAVDVTDATTSYYRDQIPYTPVHNGSLSVAAGWRGLQLAYSFVYTGERYCQQENIAYNHLQPWYTSDVHLSYDMPRWRCRAWLEVNNVFDQQYDVVINYPMPGRNFNMTLQCTF